MSFSKYLLKRFLSSTGGAWICFILVVLLSPIWGPLFILAYPYIWYKKVKAEYSDMVMKELKNK